MACLAKHLAYYYIHTSKIQTSWCREGKSCEKRKVLISTTHRPDMWPLAADKRSVGRKPGEEGPAWLGSAAAKELQGSKLVRKGEKG